MSTLFSESIERCDICIIVCRWVVLCKQTVGSMDTADGHGVDFVTSSMFPLHPLPHHCHQSLLPACDGERQQFLKMFQQVEHDDAVRRRLSHTADDGPPHHLASATGGNEEENSSSSNDSISASRCRISDVTTAPSSNRLSRLQRPEHRQVVFNPWRPLLL